MKSIFFAMVLAINGVCHAESKQIFAGSDTLAGAMTDAIIAAGMDQKIGYAGGGSGVGEKNMIAGDQGIAPMSREMKPEAIQALEAQGVQVIANVVALDGLSIFVQKGNGLASLDVPTITKIFTCEVTRWEQLKGSNLKGDIHVYRRNDSSGTTDAFKHFTGIKTFGNCVTALNETADISEKTSKDVYAIGYAGLSGKIENNKSLGLSRTLGALAVMPTTKTIRDFSYPFARKLYVYEVTGQRKPSETESALMEYVTDRSFMDPIVQAHEFITID